MEKEGQRRLAEQKTEWCSDSIMALATNMARRHLKTRVHSTEQLLRNPKGGVVLRQMQKRKDAHDALLAMVQAAEPDEVDSRMLSMLYR